jgi:hypothetical protein
MVSLGFTPRQPSMFAHMRVNEASGFSSVSSQLTK